ncbi:hypothetical protein [Salibacterium lacus]|uniref:DUF3221 domain-containing protein n=1 Tax=Salibacterium lacus TaxID=1898109 RepID=A0ABW5T3Z9_9BACI
MNKIMVAFCFVFLLSLFGCGKEESDYTGDIEKVNENSIEVVYPKEDRNPDASYPVYTVNVNEDTEFTGSADAFRDLAEGDRVQVWVINVGPDGEIHNKTAKKILVE